MGCRSSAPMTEKWPVANTARGAWQKWMRFWRRSRAFFAAVHLRAVMCWSPLGRPMSRLIRCATSPIAPPAHRVRLSQRPCAIWARGSALLQVRRACRRPLALTCIRYKQRRRCWPRLRGFCLWMRQFLLQPWRIGALQAPMIKRSKRNPLAICRF